MEKCCEDLTNRVNFKVRDDLVKAICQTCGRRHYELTVDPGKLGLKGAGLG